MLLNLMFRLFKWLLVKTSDDSEIVDICEELLDLGDFDRFIISRSNCPVCGEDFAGNHWSCNCFEEKEQDLWFSVIDYLTYSKKGYSYKLFMKAEG